MSSSDQKIKIVLICCIIIHVITSIALGANFITFSSLLFLNLLSAAAIILYWIIKQLRIAKHYFELRELVVLCLEGLICSFSLYAFFSNSWSLLTRIFSWGIFAIHLLALVAFLVFMLTFKMKKLF